MMRRCIALLALLLAPAAWLWAQQSQPQSSPPSEPAPRTFHVNVRLVNVLVNATDAHGAPVAGLTRDDFRVTEDGLPQQIRVFEKQSEQPLNIVLAIDTSGSVRKDWQVEMSSALRFLRAIVRPVDKVALLEFSTHVRDVVPFTNNVKLVEKGLRDMTPGYATAMYDAVETAAQRLRGLEGRRVVVLISDGGNTAKGATYQQAFDEAIGAEASVYSIIDVPVEASAGRELGGEHALITLSEDSGGKFYYGGNPEQLDASFRQLSEDLRTQYLLGYYAPQRDNADRYRRIGVSLAHPDPAVPVNLRYRPGYFAAQPASE